MKPKIISPDWIKIRTQVVPRGTPLISRSPEATTRPERFGMPSGKCTGRGAAKGYPPVPPILDRSIFFSDNFIKLDFQVNICGSTEGWSLWCKPGQRLTASIWYIRACNYWEIAIGYHFSTSLNFVMGQWYYYRVGPFTVTRLFNNLVKWSFKQRLKVDNNLDKRSKTMQEY